MNNSCLIEPWDGLAMVAFTEGRYSGATFGRDGEWVADGMINLEKGTDEGP